MTEKSTFHFEIWRLGALDLPTGEPLLLLIIGDHSVVSEGSEE